MKIGIVGSRNITEINIEQYVFDCDEIVSGGAVGVDRLAAEYAQKTGIVLVEFLPQYELYGRAAPIVRNKQIVDYADKIVAFWDEKSKGTLSVIRYARKVGKPCDVIICN